MEIIKALPVHHIRLDIKISLAEQNDVNVTIFLMLRFFKWIRRHLLRFQWFDGYNLNNTIHLYRQHK